MNKQLVALRDQQDPIITIWEEKGESQGIDGVKDDKVMHDLDDRTTGHISRDNILHTDRSHTT